MIEYTKNGHKLEHVDGLVFRCLTSHVAWSDADKFQRGTDAVLALLQVIAPVTRGQLAATLRAWLGAYNDPELVAQVDEVVESVFAKLPEVKAPPAPVPQQGSLN